MQPDGKKSGRKRKATTKNKKPPEPYISGKAINDENVLKAHRQADKDIEEDPDNSSRSTKDDLDEKEAVKRGKNNNPFM